MKSMRSLKLFSSHFFARFFTVMFVFFSLNSFAGVNLNTATQTELEALPGVGKKLSSEIIAKRPFKSIDDLKEVKGVGDAKFEKLKPLVSVENTVALPTSRSISQSASRSAATKMLAGEKVSLNNANLEQLEKLPGIGPKKAQAIIQARPFQSIEDVMKVKGIKAGIFNKIKDHVSL